MAAVSETLADGLDLEIMRFDVLKTTWKEARLASEREHVTMYIKIIKKSLLYKTIKVT